MSPAVAPSSLNPILAYAIEHQADAKWLLMSKGLPLDDVEDVVQDALVKLLRADPPHADNPKSYWTITVMSAAHTYWRRQRKLLPLDFDKADPRQELESIIGPRETIREVWEAAKPFQRRAIIDKLTRRSGPLPGRTKSAISGLRRRLREGAAV